jgi:hypothetical protein
MKYDYIPALVVLCITTIQVGDVVINSIKLRWNASRCVCIMAGRCLDFSKCLSSINLVIRGSDLQQLQPDRRAQGVGKVGVRELDAHEFAQEAAAVADKDD